MKNARTAALLVAVAASAAAVAAPTASAAKYCGTGGAWSVTASNATSCSFARNVASVYDNQRVVYAYSPATGSTYRMTCSYARSGAIKCSGGRGARVYLR